MRIAAIICEYNPLHRGHQAHIAWTKQHADAVICLMSGSFVQRGEPAFFDKFTRARWALQAGADIVWELPTLGALQSAQGFARAGVYLAHALGADDLSFGVECADLSALQSLADLSKTDSFSLRLQAHLSTGCSYAASAQQAAQELLPSLPPHVFGPNCTLAIEYIRAKKRYHAPLRVLPMQRCLPISSTVCRQRYLEQQSLDAFVPPFVHHALSSLRPVTWEDLEPMLFYRLRTMSPQDFASLPDCSEGLEQRLYRASRVHTTIPALLADVSTSRYPLSRIKRLLCCALLGITADLQTAYQDIWPYVRMLGLSRKAGPVMDVLRQRARIPLLDKPVARKTDPLFILEQRATDLYALCAQQPCGLDFTHPLVLED